MLPQVVAMQQDTVFVGIASPHQEAQVVPPLQIQRERDYSKVEQEAEVVPPSQIEAQRDCLAFER